MRTFEIALWLVAFGWTAWRLLAVATPRWGLAIAAIAGSIAAVHATTEGMRVHMVPVYAVLLSLAASALWRFRWRGNGKSLRLGTRIALAIPVAGWLVFAAALPSVFPVFRYDTPSGKFGIGTAVYELAGGPGRRTLVVQTWYPIPRGTKGPLAAITTHVAPLEAAYASFTGLPRLLFDNLRLVRTHAVVDAPIAASPQRFPVVLFSHGPLGANRSQSLFQMEALASAGFIAVAIDHTGYASTTIFRDGRTVLPGPEATWPVFVDSRSTSMLNTWVKDVKFVIDQLDVLNASDPRGILTGRVDTTRVGYLGASFGGSVVVQALLDEPRIKAGIAEDGKPYFSDATLTDLTRPLMYMQSAAPYIQSTDAQLARWGLTNVTFRTAEEDHYSRQMQLFGRAQSPIYNVYIRGTNHLTFSDLDLFVRLPDSTLINIRRAHNLINAYTLAFFERYLNGTQDALVDGITPSPFPEVTVAARNVREPTLARMDD